MNFEGEMIGRVIGSADAVPGSETRTNRKLRIMKKLAALIVAGLAFSALTAGAADGKTIYEEQCAKCHGKDGKGQTTMGKKYEAKDYSDAKVQEKLTDAAATKAVKEGYKNAEGKVVMKPAESLSDDDIKAVIAHLRTLKK